MSLRLRRSDVGAVTLKIAVFVALGNAGAFHYARRALFDAAVAPHGHFAHGAIGPRHQLPSRTSAECAIFQRHVPFPELSFRAKPGISLLVDRGGFAFAPTRPRRLFP